MYEKSNDRIKKTFYALHTMMEDLGHIDLFERYRNGDLNEREIMEFEARLVYDAEFKDNFEQYQKIEVGIENHFRENLKSKLIELDKTIDREKPKSAKSKRLLFMATSLAASVILGFVLFNFLNSSNQADIAEYYWPEEPGLPVKMSSKGKYDDAMNAYKMNDLRSASNLLKPILTDTSDYFQGVIAFEMDNTKESKRFLSRIEIRSIYFNKAQFRLGLILLSEGNKTSSIKIFKAQITEKTEFSKISKEILKKI